MKQKKTNALRMLDSLGIPYEASGYDVSDGMLDGVSVAGKIGYPPEQVFKTLVTQGPRGGCFVCVVPAARELDPKKAAAHFGEKRIEMLPLKDLTAVTGYVKGGCSPVGMKKQYPTAVDQSAGDFEAIVVSAGLVGLQMLVTLEGLLRAVNGKLADLTRE